MKRTKRLNIRRLALGVAAAALVVPAGAQAKPTPGPIPYQSDQELTTNQDQAYLNAVSRGNVYIPLQGKTSAADSAYAAAVSRGDVYIPLQGKPVSQATSKPFVGLGYHRGWGPIIAYTDEGYPATLSPDDRDVSKATSVGRTPYSGTVESGGDSGTFAASAFVLVLLAMSGITLVVWRNRKGGRLSHA